MNIQPQSPPVLPVTGESPSVQALPGRRFGKWVTLDEPAVIKGRKAVLCRCDCGTVRFVQENKLLSGRSKSCGCSRKNAGGRIRKDITGQKFRELTALYPTAQRNQKQSVIWHCRCNCGNEVDVAYDVLVYGSQLSCGCMKQRQRQQFHQGVGYVDGTAVARIRERKPRRDNKTGVRGVCMKRGRYVAAICFQGKYHYLGTFPDLESARRVREQAEHEMFDQYLYEYDRREQRISSVQQEPETIE